MRASTLLLLLIGVIPISAQNSSDQGTWQQFVSPQTVTAAVATDDAVWFAASERLIVHYDRENDKIDVHSRVFPGFGLQEREMRELWLGPQGRVHALNRSTQMAVWHEEEWKTHVVGWSNIPYLRAKEFVREKDGEYLFKAGFHDLYRWREGGSPTEADDILALIPFNLEHVAWDEIGDRLWIAKRRDLGYLKDGVFHTVELPTGGGEIEQLEVDATGNLWLRMWGDVRCLIEGQWQHFDLSIPDYANGASLHILGADRALIVTGEFAYTLEATPAGPVKLDQSSALANLTPDLPLAIDPEGCVWMMDVEQRRIGQWCGDEMKWRAVDQWLPDQHKTPFHLDVDQDGRVWIANLAGGYYWSNGGWRPMQELYPHSFPNIAAVLFRRSGYPVVRARLGLDPLDFYAYHPSGEWQRMSAERAPAVSTQGTRINEQGVLYSLLGIPTLVSILSRGEWSIIRSADLSPASGGILAMHLDEDGTQFLASENGVYKRFGASYDFTPFADPRIDPERLKPRFLSYTPTGVLWIAQGEEVYTWQEDSIRAMPAIPNIAELSSTDKLFEIYALADDDVWAILNDGTYANFDGQTWTIHTPPKYQREIRTLMKVVRDQRGRVWFHGSEALVVYSPPEIPEIELIESLDQEVDFVAYPNPAARRITVQWENEVAGQVSLALYNSLGQLVQQCVDEEQAEGSQEFFLARGALQAGVYYLVLQRGGGQSILPIVWK